MFKQSILTVALAAAFSTPFSASAADASELEAIRALIAEMKQSYEARLQALEQRLQDAQAATAQAQNAALAAAKAATVQAPAPAAPAMAAAPLRAPAAPGSNAFNPSVALVLGGSFARLSQDPNAYRIDGFAPVGGEIGPGRRSFSLGESELTMSANIDPMFAGQMTFALTAENETEVEEAFVRTRALASGLNFKAGRFLSALGYMNGQHAHTWDFVDAPLAYQGFFGGQYKTDGVQVTWIAPTDTFLELGAEAGNGDAFPGNDRNKNGFGATSLFAHVGGDIGASSSWRAGLSYLRTGAEAREVDGAGLPIPFSGRSRMLIADAIYKWAPNGNPTQQNFKLQGEYFRNKESGALLLGDVSLGSTTKASGWYLQSVYQFMPNWRTGLRYDRLTPGLPAIDPVDEFGNGPARFHPKRASLMLDYSPSEFSRLRLQFARDQAGPGAPDNQIFLQYIMSLGAHAAHAF